MEFKPSCKFFLEFNNFAYIIPTAERRNKSEALTLTFKMIFLSYPFRVYYVPHYVQYRYMF
jgi:hypothetical protein